VDEANDFGPSLLKPTVVDSSEVVVMTPPPSAPVPPAPTKAKCGKTTIVSDATVRQSVRVHNQNRGFKNALCKGRNCVGCSTDPPTLSVSVVCDLGSSFCKPNPASLTKEVLNDRPTKQAALSRLKKVKKPFEGGAKAKKAPRGTDDAGPLQEQGVGSSYLSYLR